MPIDASGCLPVSNESDPTEFLAIEFDPREIDEVLEWAINRPPSAPFGYVVTPNVDHIVKLNSRISFVGDFGAAYADASLRVCDSRILALLARLRGVRIPVVPGSDLTVRLIADALKPGERVSIIGGDPAVLDELRRTQPEVHFLQHVPPMGLLTNRPALMDAARFIAENPVRFCLLAVGTPQQEILANLVAQQGGSTGLGFCVGASLDFISGKQKRAPRWLQRARLEWLYRLCCNPRRFWRRYLIEGPRILGLVLRWEGAPQ